MQSQFVTLLGELESNPAEYLDGHRSLRRLAGFLAGYFFGRADHDALHNFAIWGILSTSVQDHFGLDDQRSLEDILSWQSHSDWDAFDLFWKHLHQCDAVTRAQALDYSGWTARNVDSPIKPCRWHKPPCEWGRPSNTGVLEKQFDNSWDVLSFVREYSGLYMPENRSFVCLISFLRGFEHYRQRPPSFLSDLEEWTRDKFKQPSNSLERIILFEAPSEEEAFEFFYQLVDEHRSLSGS